MIDKEIDWKPFLYMEKMLGSEFYSFIRNEFRNMVERHLITDEVTKVCPDREYFIFGFAAILDEMTSLTFNEIKDEKDAEAAKDALICMAKAATEQFIINKSNLQ